MKTKQQVQEIIDDLIGQIKAELELIEKFANEAIKATDEEVEKEATYQENLHLKRKNNLVKRMDHYKLLLWYIESSPNKEFVEKEVARIENKLRLIEEGFVDFKTQRKVKDLKKFYGDQHNAPQLEKQLEALKFILE